MKALSGIFLISRKSSRVCAPRHLEVYLQSTALELIVGSAYQLYIHQETLADENTHNAVIYRCMMMSNYSLATISHAYDRACPICQGAASLGTA